MLAPWDLESLNITELVQLCRRAGKEVSEALPKGALIKLLNDDVPYEDWNHKSRVDLFRDAIMGFLLDHWTQVQGQLTCPAKSGNPRSCYSCVDAQVMTCMTKQERYEGKILHRLPIYPKEPTMTQQGTTRTAYTIDNAPRDLGALEGELPVVLRDLIKSAGAYDQSFNVCTNKEKARKVLEALLAYDKNKGPLGAVPVLQQAAPMPTVSGQPLPAPPAVAAPPPAATAAPAASGRKPRAANGTSNGAAAHVPEAANNDILTGVLAQLQAVVDTTVKLAEAVNAVVRMVQQVDERVSQVQLAIDGNSEKPEEGSLLGDVDAISRAVDGLVLGQRTAMAMTVLAAEQITKADIVSLINDGVEMRDQIGDLITKAEAAPKG